MLYRMSEFLPFAWLNNVALYVHATFCSSVRQSVGTQVSPAFQPLWAVLSWTWIYKCLSEILCLNFGNIYPEVEFLRYMVILFFVISWGTSVLFSLPQQQGTTAHSLHILPTPLSYFLPPIYWGVTDTQYSMLRCSRQSVLYVEVLQTLRTVCWGVTDT